MCAWVGSVDCNQVGCARREGQIDKERGRTHHYVVALAPREEAAGRPVSVIGAWIVTRVVSFPSPFSTHSVSMRINTLPQQRRLAAAAGANQQHAAGGLQPMLREDLGRLQCLVGVVLE